MSFVQSLLVSTQRLDLGLAIVVGIQGALMLLWYLVPLGLVCGVIVGLFLCQTVAPHGWLLPGLIGLTSAVIGFLIARLTVYRSVYGHHGGLAGEVPFG